MEEEDTCPIAVKNCATMNMSMSTERAASVPHTRVSIRQIRNVFFRPITSESQPKVMAPTSTPAKKTDWLRGTW